MNHMILLLLSINRHTVSLNSRQLSRAFTYYEQNHFMVEVISIVLVNTFKSFYNYQIKKKIK